jgi:ABC-type Na+ efflux pump permease subunit
MFVCGYHFPASEGNDVAFDKVIAKVEEGLDAAGKSVTLTSETREGKKLEEISVAEGSFAHKALVDYFNNAEVEAKDGFKMVYYTNKYQISEISKTVDGDSTKDLCKKLDDMNLYRVKVA